MIITKNSPRNDIRAVMQNIDTIVRARFIVTVNSHFDVLENAAIAIDNGLIVAIGDSYEIGQSYQADEEIELDSHILMPGFVNTHNHASMTMLRGYADDLPLMTWLNDYIWPAEHKYVNPNFIKIGTQLGAAEMLLSGTTTCNDMYFYPDESARVFSEIGMRAVLGMIVIDSPTVWAQNSDEYFSKGIALHDEYRHHPLISTVFAPHAPYTVGDESLSRVATLAEELDCQVHMHVHETAFEIDQSMAQFEMRPIERLDRLGLLDQRLIAVHMTQLLQDEIAIIAERGVNVVHCPASNMKLASGFAPTHKLLKAGVNVALGTDGAASNNNLDMLQEMRLASLLAKGFAANPQAASARTSIEMATINGAKALNLQDITGSLEVAKAADFIAINIDNVNSTPIFNLASHLVYSAGREQITHVWVAGKKLISEREFQTLDFKKTLSEANRLSEQMKISL